MKNNSFRTLLAVAMVSGCVTSEPSTSLLSDPVSPTSGSTGSFKPTIEVERGMKVDQLQRMHRYGLDTEASLGETVTPPESVDQIHQTPRYEPHDAALPGESRP
jgi:hypothetical protein